MPIYFSINLLILFGLVLAVGLVHLLIILRVCLIHGFARLLILLLGCHVHGVDLAEHGDVNDLIGRCDQRVLGIGQDEQVILGVGLCLGGAFGLALCGLLFGLRLGLAAEKAAGKLTPPLPV